MGLASNQNSDSFSDGCFELFVKLVDTDSVDEVFDTSVVFLASENNCDTKSNKDVVVGWASPNLKFINKVLLSNQELDLCPWSAHNEATFLLNMVKCTVFGNNGISSFRSKTSKKLV